MAEATAPPSTASVDPRNKLFGVEKNGINFIAHDERTMTHRQLSLFWIASSFYPFNVLLGILVYGLGLPVWACLLVVVVVGGAASYVFPALASLPGARSGIATQAITRVTFGIQANRVNAALGWAVGIAYEVINVVTGVFAGAALLNHAGWHDDTSAKLVAFVVVYGFSVLLPYLGHATVVWVQQVFAALLAAGSLAMLVALLPKLDLGAHVADTGISPLSAVLIACGVVLAGGWGYVMVAADYPRYMPAATPSRGLFLNVLASAGGPTAFLGVVGVLMASQGDLEALVADPVGGADGLFPTVVLVVWLLAAIGGSIANNALTLYSAGLAAQALGLPLKRYQATLVDAAIATVGIAYILFFDSGSFLGWLNSVIVFTVIWLGPFGTIWLTDLAWRGWLALPQEVHGGRLSPFWGLTGARRAAWISLVAGMVAATLCISVPKWTGPVAHALGDTDVSWIAGPLVALVLYLLLGRGAVRQEMAHRYENLPAISEIDADEAFGTGADHSILGHHRHV